LAAPERKEARQYSKRDWASLKKNAAGLVKYRELHFGKGAPPL